MFKRATGCRVHVLFEGVLAAGLGVESHRQERAADVVLCRARTEVLKNRDEHFKRRVAGQLPLLALESLRNLIRRQVQLLRPPRGASPPLLRAFEYALRGATGRLE
jgi:hypothetical protein